MKSPEYFELTQYQTSYKVIRYRVEVIMNNGERQPQSIDSNSYTRAKSQGKKVAASCNCPLRDMTEKKL
jgi:hypothetical protein